MAAMAPGSLPAFAKIYQAVVSVERTMYTSCQDVLQIVRAVLTKQRATLSAKTLP